VLVGVADLVAVGVELGAVADLVGADGVAVAVGPQIVFVTVAVAVTVLVAVTVSTGPRRQWAGAAPVGANRLPTATSTSVMPAQSALPWHVCGWCWALHDACGVGCRPCC
jgi:hypothetical protein